MKLPRLVCLHFITAEPVRLSPTLDRVTG